MSVWTDLLGAETRYVDADGTSTRVVTAGHGNPVVLLHGRGGHLETWRWVIPALAVDHRVIAIDLLGHGLTATTGTTYDVDELCRHLAAAIEALDLQTFHLVGQSLGGWVAALHTLAQPDTVRSLVLVEPAGLLSEADRLADPQIARAYERGGRAFEEPTEQAVRDRLTGLVADPAVVDDELVEIRRRLYAPQRSREVHRLVRAADNSPWLLTHDRLARLAPDVLVVRGDQGHTPVNVMEDAVAALGSGRLVTVPDAKQWPQYERPMHVTDLIRTHIEKENHVILD